MVFSGKLRILAGQAFYLEEMGLPYRMIVPPDNGIGPDIAGQGIQAVSTTEMTEMTAAVLEELHRRHDA